MAGRSPGSSKVSSPTSTALIPARACCAIPGSGLAQAALPLSLFPSLTACDKATGTGRDVIMRAAIFRGGEIVVDTLPEPVPGAGQVLVKSLACGICGSDLHARKHAHHMVRMAE